MNSEAAKQSASRAARLRMLLAMTIFGTIGLFRRWIPLDSTLLAIVRALGGAAALYAVIRLGGRKVAVGAIRKRFWVLVLISIIMGFNWIFLFEAFNYTSLATATICYYMQPVFVILASPFVFHEKITPQKAVCVGLSFLGMILVSGILNTGFGGISELRGVIYGLLAGLFYAICVMWSKTIDDVPVYDRTLFELLAAGVCLIPYFLITGQAGERLAVFGSMNAAAWVALIILCVLHTGINYGLYYGSVAVLPAQTVGLYGYIDPVMSVILSQFFLHEDMGLAGWIGALLILGSAFVSDVIPSKKD